MIYTFTAYVVVNKIHTIHKIHTYINVVLATL